MKGKVQSDVPQLPRRMPKIRETTKPPALSVLGIYSQGEDEAEAQQAIQEALGLYLETAFEHDRLDQILRRAGFAQLSSITLEPAIQNQMEYVAAHQEKEIPIEVPLYLLAQQTKTAECLQ